MLTYTVPDPERRLRQINYGLIFLIAVVSLYVFTAPYVAQFYAWTDRYTGTQEHLLRELNQSEPGKKLNHVIIPAMLTDSAIYEGGDARSALNKGIWRWPASSTPDKGGNTVLLGTRFSYVKPKSEFYFMDRLHLGSELGIVWRNKTYHYKVTAITTPQPNDDSVLAQTTTPTVTLYTTTPLIYAAKRLAVIAQLEAQP